MIGQVWNLFSIPFKIKKKGGESVELRHSDFILIVEDELLDDLGGM